MPPSLPPGWHVSDHALRDLLDEIPDDRKKLETLIMDLDLKSFGLPSLQDKMDKSAGVVKGPIVLQISRMRDCGRPSLGESSPSNLIRLFLTDGHQAVNGIALEKINGLSEEKTPWGTKIMLNGEVKVEGQFILLTPSNVTVLGGRVDRLIERWSIEKSSMKGMGRKSGEVTAPKWVSFGRKDNNGEAIKNTRDFKANHVLKGATEKEEEEGEDQFEKARKEKLDAVEAADRKFAKVKVEAPKGGLSEEAKVEQMKEKMKKRGEKEEERREKRGMKGGRRGRRGSDDEPDVPSEFARPSHGITLSSFLGDNVAPPPTHVPVVAPSSIDIRGGGGMNDRGRGGRGGGRDQGRGGYGREERNEGEERRGGGYVQNGQRGNDRREGGRRGGYGIRGERGGDGGRGGRNDRGEVRGSFNGGGRGGGGSHSARDGGYGMREERIDQGVDHEGYGSGRGERREGGLSGQNIRRDGGGRGMERGRGGGGDRGGRGGGGNGRGRGGRPDGGGQSNRMDKIPSLMSEMDFPCVDGLNRGMGGMKIGGGMYSDEAKGGGIKQGTRVKAPWNDGNFYPATVCTVVAGTMATVRFDGYDQVKTLPMGVLLLH